MAPSDIGKALQGLSGALGAVGGLFAAVIALNDQVRQGWEVLNALPAWGWAAIAFVLLLLGVWQLVVWRQKRSELVRPEALRLERDNPEHLVGREDDIATLEQKCRGHGLVFLEGESGSGKSALVRAGLLPRLRQGGQLLPLVVSIWGTDWERGPQRELADELWAGLDADLREKLRLTGPPEPEALVQALGAMRGTIGVTPLLVFDQFDDYQARHREKFLPGQRNSWLPARRLRELNAFWRAVAELSEQQAAHVIVVTRSDTAAGLESVRFQEPETHWLDRLQTAFVAPLLARLADTGDAAAIRAPERGWDRLRQRLARDLERDGLVLPQQLRSALAGLRGLRYLTVADYERAGGLAGLESRLVEREIKSAARMSGLTDSAVRRLLLAMVESGPVGKTVACTLNKLIAAADDPKTNEDAVRSALDQLRSDGAKLVRRRIDPDTRSEAWLLDHDYLTRGIIAAERNANRWRVMLEDGARALAEAGTLAGRWRALLKPSEQVALLWARARGRLIYGPYSGYAGKSVARLAPYAVLAALLVSGGVAYAEWQARQRAYDEANATLQQLLFAEDGLNRNEIDALWSLASTNDERVRESFAQQLLGSTTFAERFNRNPAPVARALAGLNPARAQRLGHEAIARSGEGNPLPRQVAAINLGLLLAPTSVGISRAVLRLTSRSASEHEVQASLTRWLGVLRHLDSAQAQAALEPLLTAMKGTSDPFNREALAQAIQVLPAKLTDVQAQAALEPLLTAMTGTSDLFALKALAKAVQALATELPGLQAQAALEPVLAAMELRPHVFYPFGGYGIAPFGGGGMSDAQLQAVRDTLQALARAVQALAGELTDAQAPATLKSLLTTIESTTDPCALQTLTAAVQALPADLTDAQAQVALDSLLTTMQGTTDSCALEALAKAVRALPAELTDAQARAALGTLLSAMEHTGDPDAINALAKAVQALPAELTDAQEQAALDQVLTAMAHVIEHINWTGTDDDDLEMLARAMQALAPDLTDPQAQALDEVLKAMQGTTDSLALKRLARAVPPLAVVLTDAQAQAALDQVLKVMQGTIHSSTRAHLARVVQAIAAEFTDVQAQAALEPLLTAMKDATPPYHLQTLAEAVQALPANLTDAQAQAALEPVLTAMKDATDPYDLHALAEAVQTLSAKLTDAPAQAALEPVLTAMKDATDPHALRALAEAVQALPANLTDAQAQAALEPVLTAMKDATDPYDLQTLAEAVQALPAKLTDAQAQAALEPVLTAMKDATDPYDLQTLAEAVQALPAKLTDAQAQAALEPVLTAMKGATDPHALVVRPPLANSRTLDQTLAEAYQVLATKRGAPSGAALAGAWVGLARSDTEKTAKSFLEAANAVTASDSFDQFAILAFDLLKYPTVTAEAEAYLLQRLRERSGGQAAEAVDLWSAVGWAERRGGIDLISPPQRPKLPDAVTPGS